MIEVSDYDVRWVERFEVLRAECDGALRATCVPVLAIEHVGSTSVPGLAAKPIIDCDIVVETEHVDAASRVLAGLGDAERASIASNQVPVSHRPS